MTSDSAPDESLQPTAHKQRGTVRPDNEKEGHIIYACELLIWQESEGQYRLYSTLPSICSRRGYGLMAGSCIDDGLLDLSTRSGETIN